ncbi:MAG: hypothetical protein GY928_36865 [Colwellia sp.]|nr:hypothetical protein [Colwellia sp.]
MSRVSVLPKDVADVTEKINAALNAQYRAFLFQSIPDNDDHLEGISEKYRKLSEHKHSQYIIKAKKFEKVIQNYPQYNKDQYRQCKCSAKCNVLIQNNDKCTLCLYCSHKEMAKHLMRWKCVKEKCEDPNNRDYQRIKAYQLGDLCTGWISNLDKTNKLPIYQWPGIYI